jgi:hypothetical protein
MIVVWTFDVTMRRSDKSVQVGKLSVAVDSSHCSGDAELTAELRRASAQYLKERGLI